MKVLVQVKSIARRKPVIDKIVYEIPDNINNSNDLVKEIVTQNVKEFNKKEIDKPIFKYLIDEEIKDLETTGKIGFNDKKNDKIQDENEAIENAITSYYDGIFKVFINEEEVEYNTEIVILENDVLTFIRLTMLAGGMWHYF